MKLTITTIVLLVLLLLFFGVIVILMLKIKALRKIKIKLVNDLRKTELEINFLKKTSSKTEVRKKVWDKNEVEKSTKIVEATPSEVEDIELKEDVLTETIKLKISNDDTTIIEKTIIYLPEPFENCKFAAEEGDTSRNSNALYKITLEDKLSSNGVLDIITDADLSRALNSPKQYLETACSYKNAFATSFNSVNQVQAGLVQLKEKDWVVLEKVKIEFQ